jgi:cell fate (sporulation/competence/biofilm development) regulator YlbF (YheA/YmcA/DUF963 family)
MSVNLYDAAYALEKEIRQSDEYKHLQQMYNEVNADPTAKNMFDNFRQIQMNLQQKQMTGQEISEQEVQHAQSTVALVQQNEKIASRTGSSGCLRRRSFRTNQRHHLWRCRRRYQPQ